MFGGTLPLFFLYFLLYTFIHIYVHSIDSSVALAELHRSYCTLYYQIIQFRVFIHNIRKILIPHCACLCVIILSSAPKLVLTHFLITFQYL
jgi:hypothetical protein